MMSVEERINTYILAKHRSAVQDFYKDEDGWWICLYYDSGFYFEGYYSEYSIHEDTLQEAVNAYRQHIQAKH